MGVDSDVVYFHDELCPTIAQRAGFEFTAVATVTGSVDEVRSLFELGTIRVARECGAGLANL